MTSGVQGRAGRLPTVQDVAELAQVSTATVSRVLNSSARVSDAARDRVREAVRRLDYVPSVPARTLQPGSRSRSWGLLVDDVDSHYFGRLVAELDRAAQAYGSTLFTTSTQRQWEREELLIREMRGRRIDGLLIVPTARDDHGLDHRVAGGPPVVYVDRIPRGVPGTDVVTFDYYRPISEELRGLWDRGHRRFCFIGGNVAADPGSRRFAAFTDFLHDHGLVAEPELVSNGNGSEDDAVLAFGRMVDHPSPPTVVVTTQACLLLGVLRVVASRRPPVEILSAERVAAAFLTPVPLHVIATDPALMAQTAAERLQQRIDGETTPHGVVMLPTTTEHLGPPAP